MLCQINPAVLALAPIAASARAVADEMSLLAYRTAALIEKRTRSAHTEKRIDVGNRDGREF